MELPILVTGALGNVGTEVIKQLQVEGHVIRAADIAEEKLREKFGDAVECIRFDFCDERTYEATFKGVQKMFLMRPPHISNVKRDLFPSIDAAKRAGVKHVVFLSLIGIEKLTFVPHYKVEQHLKEIGLQTTFLRCSFFMQNLNTTHRQEIKGRSELFVPVGNAKTSFIDVRDIGAVAAVILTEEGHAGKNYDLTGSERLDYWQVAKLMSEELGRKIIYRNPNPLGFFAETIQRGMSFLPALVITGLYTSTRFGMADLVTNEVQQLIRRTPITFKQYLRDYHEMWMKE